MASKGKSDDMFLYWGSGSPPCWRVMIVLAEKKLWNKEMNKLLQFSKGEHKQDEILALNPRGQLPTFKDGDVVVNESEAVCLYLEEKYGKTEPRLMPTDLNKRAQVYQRIFEVSNISSNILKPLLVYRFMNKDPEKWDKKLLEEGKKKAKEELDRWNTLLSGKKYICGDDFTLADVMFYPLLALLKRNGANLSGYPELERYYDQVSQRDSVQATWPPHWKESEGPNHLRDDFN